MALNLGKINPNKAAGPDGILSKDLAAASVYLAEGLNTVFQKSLDTLKFPTKWKLARVSTVFKKGNTMDPTNYRPLSLLSLPGKLLESQFCSSLDIHLETNNLLNDNQWGFRKGRSTETLLTSMVERWKQALDDNKIIGAIFIDFRKAFDTVPHDLLPYKLQAAGIMGGPYTWLLDYLDNRQQFTEISGSRSSTKCISYGVPQGSLLGPRLFSIYVNDLPDAVSAGKVQMYADDTTVYCIGTNMDSVTESLNTILNQIYEWCQRNRLSLHPGKSEAMLISTTTPVGPLQLLKYGSNSVEFVDSTRCLGIEIDNKLSWSCHINNICKTYLKKLGAMKRMPRLPSKILEEIYFKTVIPGVTYCISVWGNCSTPLFNKLEEIHVKAARFIHRLPSSNDNSTQLQKLKWQPLSHIYKRKILVQMHQIYYGTAPKQIMDLFSTKEVINKTRRARQFVVERPKKEAGRLTLTHRGTLIWNTIPNRVKDCEDKNTFKSQLKGITKHINNITFEKESSSITNKNDQYYYY